MATTAEINDLLEPLLKNTEITSELQKKVKDVYSSLLDNLKKSANGIKFETGTLNINGMLGVDKKISIANASKYIFLQRTILTKIENAVKTSNIQISPEGIKLGDILGTGAKDSLLTSIKFNTLRKKILNSLITQLDDKTLKFISPDQKIDISGILGTSVKDNIFVTLKFNALRKKILNSLTAQLDDKTLKFISPEGLTIGSILGDTPQMGVLNKLKLSKLRGKILSAIEGQISGEGKEAGKGIRVFEEEAKPVRIVDFEGDAEKDLNKILGVRDAVQKQKEDKPAPGGSKLLLSVLAPLLLGVGGAMALFKGFDDEGPLKGAKILIGKLGVLGSLKWLQSSITKLATKFTGFLSKLPTFLTEPIEKFISGAIKIGTSFFTKIGGGLSKIPIASMLGKLGGKILKGLKFIPFVGSIIDFYDAYKRFEQGKWGTGILSLLTGIVGLIPGVGTAIKIAASVGIGVFNAIADAKQGDKEKIPDTKKFSIKQFTSKILEKIADWFKSTSIFRLSRGIYEVFTGNISEGAQQMGEVLGSLPIIGKPFTSLLGVLQEKGEQITAVPGNQGKSLGVIFKEYIIEKTKKAFNKIITIGKGYSKIFTGDIKEGLTLLSDGFSGVPVIGSVFSTFNSLFGEETAETSMGGQEQLPKKSMIDIFKAKALEKIKELWGKMPKWVKWGLEKILPEDVLSKLNKGENSAESVSASSESNSEVADQRKQKILDSWNKIHKGKKELSSEQLQVIYDNRIARGFYKESPTLVEDFAGERQPGSMVGFYKKSPVISKANDFIIGAKSGGPIERKLTELVDSVNKNMGEMVVKVSESIAFGIKNIQPTIMPIPPPAVNIPPPSPAPMDSSRAPSYAMGKIYNQRAKFYALYGGV